MLVFSTTAAVSPSVLVPPVVASSSVLVTPALASPSALVTPALASPSALVTSAVVLSPAASLQPGASTGTPAPSADIYDGRPSWSPDGTRIAFMRRYPPSDRADIVVVDVASGTLRTVVESDYDDRSVTWSADGAWLLFASNRTGRFELFLVRPDGSDLRQLTTEGGDDPAWSPDGRSMGFTSDRNGSNDVFVLDLDTRDVRTLLAGPGYDMVSAGGWSPDETRIIVATSGDEPFPPDATTFDSFRLLVLTFGSGEPAASLVDLPGKDSYACWTPDGQFVLFPHRAPGEAASVDRYGTTDLDVRSGRVCTLLGGRGNQFDAGVSPDGPRVVFHDSADGGESLWLADRNGGGRRRLTATPLSGADEQRSGSRPVPARQAAFAPIRAVASAPPRMARALLYVWWRLHVVPSAPRRRRRRAGRRPPVDAFSRLFAGRPLRCDRPRRAAAALAVP